MLRLVVAAAVVVTALAAARAQPQAPPPFYNFTLSAPLTQRLWTIIQKVPLPREETEELTAELLRQVREQDDARAKAAATAKEKKK